MYLQMQNILNSLLNIYKILKNIIIKVRFSIFNVLLRTIVQLIIDLSINFKEIKQKQVDSGLIEKFKVQLEES